MTARRHARTNPSRRRALLAPAILFAAIVGGCLGRSPEVRHFVLGRPTADAVAPSVDGLAVLVGPVRLPEYLERAQIARLEASGEVRLDETNRWLGGFESNLLRALATGLAERLDSARVVSHPSNAPFEMDYRIRIHVDDLVAQDDERLRVRIRWALQPSDPEEPVALFVMDRAFAIAGVEPEALVAAHETALSELVEAMARSIEQEGAAVPD
jgi:uncharacterized lipoprotein YmbA